MFKTGMDSLVLSDGTAKMCKLENAKLGESNSDFLTSEFLFQGSH